ncbi:hypothetical protein PSV08DRAFT_367828 [Bipolaris maydis]|nr:hypothetical protein J3E73DRAFT_393695 [Bipolaris maydis]KAJ6274152.1 hypothetical protein PSV08DRAFT_367828 [Bipolaris maydis]
MGHACSKPLSQKNETIGHMPVRIPLPVTGQEKTKESLWDLVNDGKFQAEVVERSFRVFLHEDLPDYWKLQFDLLVVLKFVFDRIKPRSITVIFPNRPLRYPTGNTEALLKLASIETLHQGIQLWTEYLAQTGSLHLENSDWQSAFQKTREGYRFNLIQTEDKIFFQDNDTHSQELHTGKNRRSATEEMTKTIQDVYSNYNLVEESSHEALKERISQKARDLLPRYMEPVPLDFAVHNYESLMRTSYDAGTGIGLTNVALQAFTDAKESSRGGLGSKIDIIVVKGTVPRAHVGFLLETNIEVQNNIYTSKKSKKLQTMDSCGICFAILPNTGAGDIWNRLSYRGNRNRGFCNSVELPTNISPHAVTGEFVRRMVLGSAYSTAL